MDDVSKLKCKLYEVVLYKCLNNDKLASEVSKSILNFESKLSNFKLDEVVNKYLCFEKKVCNEFGIDVNKFRNIVLSVVEVSKYTKPPKEWFERVVSRLMEEGYSEDSAKRLAGWIYYHHLKPHKPKSEREPDKPSTAEARARKRKYLQTNKSQSRYRRKLENKIDKLDSKIKQFDDWLVNLALELEDMYEQAKKEGDDSASLIREVCERLESVRVQVKSKLKSVVKLVR